MRANAVMTLAVPTAKAARGIDAQAVGRIDPFAPPPVAWPGAQRCEIDAMHHAGTPPRQTGFENVALYGRIPDDGAASIARQIPSSGGARRALVVLRAS